MGPSELTLVLGGASSGKSALAEQLAGLSGRVTYIATALAADDEMLAKIRAHQRRRPANWRTIEVTQPNLATCLKSVGAETILIDSMTLYAGAVMTGAVRPDEHMHGVIEAIESLAGKVVVVSDEVGLGVVPASTDGRAFREFLGRINQNLAAAADNVYFVAAGLPFTLKGKAIVEDAAWL